MIGSYKKIQNFFPVPRTPRVFVIQRKRFLESCLLVPTAPVTRTYLLHLFLNTQCIRYTIKPRNSRNKNRKSKAL